MKRLALLVAVALFGLLAAPAHAATSLSDAVNALKTSPVFVAPDANPTMSPTDAQRVKSQILAGREPIFVAVLPTATAQAEGGVDNLPHALALGVAKQGVFAVVAGNSIRAGASAGLGFNAGEIQQIANRAIASSNPRANGIGALLSSFVAQVDAHRPTTSPAPKSSPAKGTSGWKVFLIVLASLVLVGLVIFGIWGLTKRSARKRQEADELEAFDNELNTLNSRLSAVSEDVVNLGSKMLTDDTRKEAYDKMVLAYSQAKSVLEKAKSTSDLDAAADYLETAETQRAAAQGIKVTDQDGKKIVQATTPKKARTPRKPRNVVVTEAKYQPSPERTTVNQYYYPTGGYYNGMYFGPGYYADPFWTWVEMDMMADAMADRYDHGSDSSDSGDYDSGSSSGTGDWDSGSSSSDSGGGDWGGSSDSGGGDYGGGGGDYGGGGDFGGGGGDFGGGGGGDF